MTLEPHPMTNRNKFVFAAGLGALALLFFSAGRLLPSTAKKDKTSSGTSKPTTAVFQGSSAHDALADSLSKMNRQISRLEEKLIRLEQRTPAALGLEKKAPRADRVVVVERVESDEADNSPGKRFSDNADKSGARNEPLEEELEASLTRHGLFSELQDLECHKKTCRAVVAVSDPGRADSFLQQIPTSVLIKLGAVSSEKDEDGHVVLHIDTGEAVET